MKKIEKSEIYGFIGSIIAGILLLLLLYFCKLTYFIHTDNGLTVNFGDTMAGQGLYEPAPMSVLEDVAPVEPTSVPTPTPPAPVVEAPLQTQNIQESIEAREAHKKEQQRLKEERERQRIEQERLAEQKRAEEEKARQILAIKSKAQGAFAGAGASSGSGEGTGTTGGNQGNPFASGGAGSGSGTGNGSGVGKGGSGATAKVGTRSIVGTLPKPSDNTPVEGIIVIDIVVDENGNVTETSFGTGTNITESAVRNAAISAAKKTKFTKGTKTEFGTITYRYTLN